MNFYIDHEDSIILWDGDFRSGGSMPPKEGVHGIAFEAFKRAGSGRLSQINQEWKIFPPLKTASFNLAA